MTTIADITPPPAREVINYKEVAEKLLEALQWVSMTSYERDVLREDMRYWKEMLRP